MRSACTEITPARRSSSRSARSSRNRRFLALSIGDLGLRDLLSRAVDDEPELAQCVEHLVCGLGFRDLGRTAAEEKGLIDVDSRDGRHVARTRRRVLDLLGLEA